MRLHGRHCDGRERDGRTTFENTEQVRHFLRSSRRMTATTRVGGTLRITMVIDRLAFGGAERVVIDLLRNLPRSRFAPSLVLLEGEKSPPALIAELPNDVPVVRIADNRISFPMAV